MNGLIRVFSNLSTVRSLQAFQVLRFVGFFLTGILLAKSFAPTAAIGTYEKLMFLSAATGFFWVSGILNALLGMHGAAENEKQERLFGQTFLILVIVNIILVAILKLAEQWVISITGTDIRNYYNSLLLLILFNNPAFLTEYIFLLRRKSKLLLLYGVISFMLAVIITVAPFYSGWGLEQSLHGLIILAIIRFVLTFLVISKKFLFSLDSALLRQQWKLTLPLIGGLLISGSADYIDGFLVTLNFGPEAFAYFRYGAREFPLSLLMANALSMAMVPVLSKDLHTGMPVLKKEASTLMHWFFLPLCLLMIFSDQLYPFLFRSGFEKSAEIFNIYLLLLISRMIFPQTVVMALQRNIVLFRFALVELGANVLLSISLMHWIGIRGIAYGTVLAFLLEKLLLVAYLAKSKKIKPDAYTDLRTWLIYTLIMLVSYILGVSHLV